MDEDIPVPTQITISLTDRTMSFNALGLASKVIPIGKMETIDPLFSGGRSIKFGPAVSDQSKPGSQGLIAFQPADNSGKLSARVQITDTVAGPSAIDLSNEIDHSALTATCEVH